MREVSDLGPNSRQMLRTRRRAQLSAEQEKSSTCAACVRSSSTKPSCTNILLRFHHPLSHACAHHVSTIQQQLWLSNQGLLRGNKTERIATQGGSDWKSVVHGFLPAMESYGKWPSWNLQLLLQGWGAGRPVSMATSCGFHWFSSLPLSLTAWQCWTFSFSEKMEMSISCTWFGLISFYVFVSQLTWRWENWQCGGPCVCVVAWVAFFDISCSTFSLGQVATQHCPCTATHRISPLKLFAPKSCLLKPGACLFRAHGHMWTWRPLMADPSSLSTDRTAEIPSEMRWFWLFPSKPVLSTCLSVSDYVSRPGSRKVFQGPRLSGLASCQHQLVNTEHDKKSLI